MDNNNNNKKEEGLRIRSIVIWVHINTNNRVYTLFNPFLAV